MKKMHNGPTAFFRAGLFLLIAVGVLANCAGTPESRQIRHAEAVAERFADAVDYNRPEDIYPLLLPEYREMITKKDFMANFAHERSYPYLTPLWIYVDDIIFNDDFSEGTVLCTVASRLPGEFMEFRVVLEDGRYWIDALRTIVDGTYVEIFDKLD